MSARRKEDNAITGRDMVVAKLQEAIDFLQSEPVAKVVETLDSAPETRLRAVANLRRFLSQNGVTLPRDIEFSLEPIPAGREHGRLTAKVKIVCAKR